MPTNVLERIGELRTQEEDLLAMHFGAIRVLDSTKGGGWGTFGVDGLNDDQAARLPDYVGEFVGERLPRIYYDIEGRAQLSSGPVVRPEHTRFAKVGEHYNEERDTLRTFFRWDRSIWDPEVAELQAQEVEAAARHQRHVKIGVRAGIAILSAVELGAISGMLVGLNRETRQDATAAEIRDAKHLSELSMEILAGNAAVSSVGAIAVISSEITRPKRRPKK